MKKAKGKKLLTLLVLALLSFSTALLVRNTKHEDAWEGLLYDFRTRLVFGGQEAPREVVVVFIDELSLRAMEPIVGRWPWPRRVHADLINFLVLGGAKLIVYDILFSERSERLEDLSLAEATANSERTIHAMLLYQDPEGKGHGGLPNDLISLHSLKNTELQRPEEYTAHAIPYPELYRSSVALGVVEFSPDPDGVYRRTSLIKSYNGSHFPNLALSAFLQRLKNYQIRQEGNFLIIHSDKHQISLPYKDGKYLVKLYGRFETYSMSGLLASIQALKSGRPQEMLVSPEEFRDKVVFVGASAVGLEDLKPTPVGPAIPGVILHASTYSNLLLSDFILPAPNTVNHILSLSLSTFVALSLAFSLKRGVPIALLLIVGYFVGSVLAFRLNILLEMLYPTLAGVLSLFSGLVFLALTEERERRAIRRTFERYVSTAMLAELEKGVEESLSGRVGSRVEVTIMFSDIRGFTELSEKLPPEKVVELLNIYFDTMVEVIFQKGGTVDKFVGDAILAFWGAPIRRQDHAKRAVECALQMRKALKQVNAQLHSMNLPTIENGIGINTSEVVLGSVGSKKRMDYTVIGDGVNLASRLEGLTRFYGVSIIVSESTAERLEGAFILRPLDLVRVKGKQKPIKIYQVMEEDGPFAQLHSRAFEAYLARDWHRASWLFEEALRLKPEDKTARLFLQRCKAFMESPPPEDWDGVWEFREK